MSKKKKSNKESMPSGYSTDDKKIHENLKSRIYYEELIKNWSNEYGIKRILTGEIIDLFDEIQLDGKIFLKKGNLFYVKVLPIVNEIVKDYNDIMAEYKEIKSERDGIKKQLKEKDKELSKYNIDYHKLRKELESKIEDLKVKLSGKTSEVKQLEDRLSYEVEEKNTWKDIYRRDVAKWRIESLDDEEYEYFASWRNPTTNKVEKYEIPKDFNPHSIMGMSRDENDFYHLDYYSEIDDIVVSIHIPISLFEELKKKIEPKKTTQIKSFNKNKKRILVKVDDLNQIKKIYADNGLSKYVTPEMERIVKVFLNRRDIPITTMEIKKESKVSQGTVNDHLNYMVNNGIIERLSRGKYRLP